MPSASVHEHDARPDVCSMLRDNGGLPGNACDPIMEG